MNCIDAGDHLGHQVRGEKEETGRHVGLPVRMNMRQKERRSVVHPANRKVLASIVSHGIHDIGIILQLQVVFVAAVLL